ncbi:MAG TPA: alkaline phosphatase family protein, partial [Baekduia sp.]
QGGLANEIALVSGQGPTPQTALNCPEYADIAPATIDKDGQVLGDGCVYPAATQTLGDQLSADGKSWKAYVEDIGNGPAPEATTCRHPALGTADAEQAPRPGDAYVTWRNPFVYFHSIVDDSACASDDTGLSQLSFDLTSAATTPSVSYIVPNRCHDGSDEPCVPGQPAGLAAADTFLKSTVEQIQRSPAYKDGGLIAITFDQAPATGDGADTTSCCTTVPFPNLPSTATPASTAVPSGTLPASTATPAPSDAVPAVPTPPAATDGAPASTTVPGTTSTPASGVLPGDGSLPGGGRTGLLLLSPFVEPGTTNLADSYNHFSLLRSIEDLFGLDHLGYAADPALPAFDKVVYNVKAKTK